MLQHLSIKHYALIEHLDINFDGKFNILTGETGSGKSIVLGAMSLLLGDRADISAVQEGKSKCVVEGNFDIQGLGFEPLFEKFDLDFEHPTVIRREIIATGKSRAFVNDTPVNLKVLKSFGLKLIDLHSQHQTLQINDPLYQLGILDKYAGTADSMEKYKVAYANFDKAEKALRTAEEEGRAAQNNLEFMRFQLEELEAARLDDVDEEALEEELNMLGNADEIAGGLSKALYALTDGDAPVRTALQQALESLSQLSKYAKTYEELSERLKSAEIEIDDIAAEADALLGKIEADPKRLSVLEDVQSTLYRLGQKHGADGVAALIALRNELRKSVAEADNLDDRLDELKALRKAALEETGKAGSALRKKRQASQAGLNKEIVAVLKGLNMPDAQLETIISPLEKPGPLGMDRVEFLFSANAGRKPAPLKEVASGGELSRLMLAVKYITARSGLRTTIVFDEIDTGVSGEVADSMGAIMRTMADGLQVICITHLPQIAAKGSAHYKVFKEIKNGRTFTDIARLDESNRIREIAQMLSGAKTTDAALANAKDLLESA